MKIFILIFCSLFLYECGQINSPACRKWQILLRKLRKKKQFEILSRHGRTFFFPVQLIDTFFPPRNDWYSEAFSTHRENYVSISFHVEWDMIVVTVFLSILNQMEFLLYQNRKKNCHHDHIPFNLKGNEILIFSVYAQKKN